MKFTIYKSDSIGDAKNCSYPFKETIDSVESLKMAAVYDHTCPEFNNNYRNVANFIQADVLVLDCDNDHTDDSTEWIYPDTVKEIFADVNYALATSRHDMLLKNGKSERPRFHLYFPHAPIQDAKAYKKLKERIQSNYPFFDDNALDASRFIFGHNSTNVVWHEGSYNIDFMFGSESEKRTIPEGRRNSTMSRFAGRVIKRYGITERAYDIFLEEAEKCDPPLPDDELLTIWQSAVKFGNKLVKQDGYVPPDKYNNDFGESPGYLKPDDYSDIGQAKILAREYGNELRYCDAFDFLRYNGVFWEDSKEVAIAAAEEFLDLQLADAFDCINETTADLKKLGEDPKTIKAGGKKAIGQLSDEALDVYENYLDACQYHTFVMKRRDMRYIMSALQAAKPMLLIKPEEFDANPYLLNTPSFTYDLRYGMSGKREHAAEDFITKVTAYDPGDEGSELWNDAVDKLFLSDAEMTGYVQQVFGMAAVGKVMFEAMIIANGEGNNGKSTCCNTAARVLGTYSGNISADSLTVGCKRNVKPEMAELKGKRLIIAAEMDEGMRLSSSVVKQLCSTDAIYAEKKYEAPFSYIPSHTILLYTNHLPRVGAMDKGIWRRLLVIPFKAEFEKSKDIKNYADYLCEKAAPAVLAWIIQGAEAVIKNGFRLDAPDCVREANEDYKDQNNWLANFLEERCIISPALSAKSGELYRNYREYCLSMGEYARSTTDFYTALINKGFTKKRTPTGRFIKGLSLKGDFNDEELPPLSVGADDLANLPF